MAVPQNACLDELGLRDIGLEDMSLLTDLYQITMAACYSGERLENRSASFELFTRKMPADFGYLVAMGLQEALRYLEALRFTTDQITALQNTKLFKNAPDRFWQLLKTGSFTGTVWAVPEGTIVLPNEPILRVEAPLWQAQWVETYLLNVINYQTLVATRSARIRDIAGDDAKLYEFGTRRAFSPQAALFAARAAIAAGFDGTSNVLAALQLGRVPVGTMAHSLVMALAATEGSEAKAFEAFHRYFPAAPLLIDTYDTIAAAKALKANPPKSLTGVRIDSGDLVALSKEIRDLLPGVAIVASGDLDEFRIEALKAEGACLDGYGIGTQLVTGNPVNGVYKLVEIDGIPVMKEALNKTSYPGRKQVFRSIGEAGLTDRIGLMTDTIQSNETPLLQKMMENGQRLHPEESLETIAIRTRKSVLTMPLEMRKVCGAAIVVPDISPSLDQLVAKTKRSVVP
jgi:nicotinate phosphoribosyltransferase